MKEIWMDSTSNVKHLLFYISPSETATAILFGFHYYGCKYSLSLGLHNTVLFSPRERLYKDYYYFVCFDLIWSHIRSPSPLR